MPSSAPRSGDEVDEGEDQDPDQVDEVPVETDDFDGAVVLRGVRPLGGTDEDAEQVDDAGQNVAAVEPGQDEEGCAEQGVDAPRVRGDGHALEPVGRQHPVRRNLLHPDRVPRLQRSVRRHLPVLHLRPCRPGGVHRGEQQRRRNRRSLLALRRPDLDPGLHVRLPHRLIAERRTALVTGKTKDHAEPNYWMVWLAPAILTVIELLVGRVAGARALLILSPFAPALAKAALVAAYFMHLKFEKYALILVVLSPLVLSGILYVGLVPDAITHIHWLMH